jgi:UDP-N-acetylmuramate: L-alanyl-gamma-D-glutamyl-meso-diaminopimelate ligase
MKDVSLYPDAHLRVFDRPALPDPGDLEDVYLIGICGTGMGSLAGLFRQSGYEVRGSDHAAYPPMSTRLARAGIQVIEGYRAENLEPEPGLVIVGNACVPTHPEAARSRERALAQASFPEALARYFIGRRRSLVVAGTHGKSTTTALLAHVLLKAGVDPGFLIGGVLVDRDTSCSVGSGEYFVVEGDEYDSAYFDKRPKFLHYRPWAAVVTSLEFDHADIYDDFEDYRQAFIEFVRLVPREGLLVLNAHDPSVVALAREAQCRIRKYAVGNDLDDADIRAVDLRHSPEGVRFRLEAGEDAVDVRFPMAGLHNVQNALAATSLALASGLSLAQATAGL